MTRWISSWLSPWPDPGRKVAPAPVPLLAGAGVAALFVALVLPAPLGPGPAGLGLTACALAAVTPGAVAAFRRGRTEGRARPVGRMAAALGAVTAGLAVVPALSDSAWLVAACCAASFGLATVVLLDARRWPALLAAVPVFGTAVLRAPRWAVRALPRPAAVLVRLPPSPVRLALARGLMIGGALAAVVAGLLASADATFARLLSVLWPDLDLAALPARAVVFGLAGLLTLGGALAGTARVSGPRRAVLVERHPAEWLTPLLLTGVVLAAFIGLQVAELFGGTDRVLAHAGSTYAGRAHEGFGQLLVVTGLVVGLLGWAGRAAAAQERHRRRFGLAGGAMLALTLLLAVSALRRLWLYQAEYGWTVRRVNAGALEIWVVTALLGMVGLWLARRTDLIPRAVAGSAGLGLLVLAALGPDALVARADVARFEQTRKIDTAYLSRLSADAVPALDRLPEPYRSCVLADRPDRPAATSGWTGWNLARQAAAALGHPTDGTGGSPAC